MLRRIVTRTTMAIAGATLICATTAQADDVKLPSAMAFTAYDTGSSGFNIAVAVGKMMQEKYKSSVRVLPAGNDVARLAPLRAKRAVVSAMGTGSYFAQEGVFEFGAKEWGPQPIQLMLSTIDCNGLSVGYMGTAVTFGFVGYYLAAGVPPLLAAGLLFLTPISFLMSTVRNSRQLADRLAFALGLVIGPVLAYNNVGLDLLWTGVAGGLLAYGFDRLRRATA